MGTKTEFSDMPIRQYIFIILATIIEVILIIVCFGYWCKKCYINEKKRIKKLRNQTNRKYVIIHDRYITEEIARLNAGKIRGI